MTKKEALEKIKELEEYIKYLDTSVGYKNDRMFLLSREEYERYKNIIPFHRTYWWLSSPGDNFKFAAYVVSSGWVPDCGDNVDDEDVGIRPALKYEGLES